MVIHSVLNCELRNSGFLHHLHTCIRTRFNEFSMTSQTNKINKVIIFSLSLSNYRSTSLCQTCLSRIHGLCRSDHPFPNFSPILHCNSTLLMSNSVIIKTRLFRSDFSFPKVNFPLVYHCVYRSGQKVKRSE